MSKSLQKKRESILDAATQVFATNGYDGCSMDQISLAAKASKRTVYNHFPSKEILFRAVIERFMTSSHELKQIQYDPHATLESQLGKFADAMLSITRNRSWLGLMKVMTGVVIANPGLIAETLSSVNTQEDTLVTWIEAAIAHGRLKRETGPVAASAFWASLQGAFLLPAIYGESIPGEAAHDLKNEFIRMFLALYEVRGP